VKPVACPWCGCDDVPLTVRVYGEPAPHITTIVDGSGIEVCVECALPVYARAVEEQDERSRRPIVCEWIAEAA
jgi:ribosome-binding protein aMBF1 (putative translation factor)